MRGFKMLSAVSFAAALLVTAGSASAAPAPKVAARPRKAMVGAAAAVKGKGFPADTDVQLRECGRTFWLAPADPCTEEVVTVRTDAKGRFQTTFEVGLCPEGEATKKPTQRVCHLGVLADGEDTGSLLGAARLIVTYP